jgi:hypothetical protein
MLTISGTGLLDKMAFGFRKGWEGDRECFRIRCRYREDECS